MKCPLVWVFQCVSFLETGFLTQDCVLLLNSNTEKLCEPLAPTISSQMAKDQSSL